VSGFDPAQHRMVPEQRWFDDFFLGERFVLPSRTMTDAVFLAFQAASGDAHPIHYDVEFCRARGMPQLLAHGFQVAAQTCPGAGLFPYMIEESIIGFLEQSSRFLKPVYAGDTTYPTLTVVELTPGRSTGVIGLASTVHNQRRDCVMEGSQRYLVRKRPVNLAPRLNLATSCAQGSCRIEIRSRQWHGQATACTRGGFCARNTWRRCACRPRSWHARWTCRRRRSAS
jgi:acyl dehydratase